MRCHWTNIFFKTFTITLVFLSSTVLADDAFNKLFSSGKYKEAITYADEKLPIAGRESDVWAKLGVAHEEQKLIEKALACFMVSIRLDQKNYEGHLGAARVYNKMGQPDKALEMAKKAMEIKPTGEAAWTYAQACISQNRVGEAKTALQKVVEVDPKNIIAQRALGNVYYKEKNYKKAVAHLKKAYASKPDGETALDLANAYKIIGNLDSAAIFYREASRDRKTSKPEATIELARIYYRKKKYGDAAKEFSKVNQSLLTGMDLFQFAISIEKSKGNEDKMIKVFNASTKKFGDKPTKEVLIAKEKIGKAYLKQKKYDAALSALEFVRKSKGDSKVDPEILFLIADAYEGKKQLSRSVPLLEAIIARNKKNVEAYARLADLYEKLKMTSKAKTVFEKLLSLQPNSPSVYLSLGDYNLKAKKYEEALKHYQKSFTLDRKAPAAIGMMKASWELKKYDIARDAAESALHKDKKLKEPQLVLAKIFIKEKNYGYAQKKLEELLKDDSKNIELLELLALCYENLKDKEKLSEIDKRIIAIDKKNVSARLRYARFSQESGDIKSAKSILIDLVKLQPKNSDILKSLYEISIKTGEKNDARRYLADYLKQKPRDAQLQKALGDLLYEAKDKSGALTAYRAALKIDPSIKGLYKRYAEAVMAQKSGGKAEQQEVLNVLNAAVKAGEANSEIYATLGTIYKNKGDYAKAIDMFQKALQKDPKDVESLTSLAYCQEKAGKYSDAIISYEQAAVLNTGSVKEYKSLGDLYMKSGKKDQAIVAYKKYIAKASNDNIAKLVADHEYNLKKYKDAVKYYSSIKGASANSVEVLRKHADAAYKSGDSKKAAELYKPLTVKAPKDPVPFKTLYEISLKTGNKKDAAKYLKKYTQIRTKDVESLQKLGDLYYELKNYKEALNAYRDVHKTNPKAKGFFKRYIDVVSKHGTPNEKTDVLNMAVAAGEADAQAYYQLGTTYMKSKKYRKALEYFEKTSQLDPKNVDALRSVAECQKKTGATASAILTYEQVIALDPKADNEYKALGDLYKMQKKTGNAVNYYKKYLTKNKDNSIAVFVGDAALKNKKYSEAITYYTMVKGKMAESSGFLFNYGQACFKAKDYDKALEVYKRLATVTPKNPEVFNTLFELHFKRNRKNEALGYLKKYVALKPADAKAQKTLGDILYARKDKTGAINAYRSALKANQKIRGFRKKYAELVIETGKPDEIAEALSGAIAVGEANVTMYRRLGSIYMKQKKYSQAIPLFEKASQMDPKDTGLLSDLAEAQAKSGNRSAALLTYEQVIALNPKADKEFRELGDLYKAENKTDQSIKYYKKYLEKNKDDRIAREVAEYSFSKKQYSESVKYFDMINGPTADSVSVLKLHAEAAFLAKDNIKALSLYSKLSAKQPKNSSVLKKLYEIAESSKKKDDMLLYLKKYTNLNSKDANAQKKLGDILYAREDTTGALAAYSAAHAADPKAKGFFKKYAALVIASGKKDQMAKVLSSAIAAGEADVDMYVRLGSIYLQQKNYPGAMSLFEKASQLEPKNTSILGYLANTQVAAGNISAAILTYEQIVAMNPNAEKEQKELGNLYWKQKKTDQALRTFKSYLEKKQDNEVAKLVGKEMHRQKNYKEAKKYLGMVTGSAANDPKHLLFYAQTCQLAQDNFKAYELYKQLANITPKDPGVFKELYVLAEKAGTKNDVLKYLRKYTTLKPKDAQAQKMLGDILYSQKDHSGALAAYRAARKADPKIKGFYNNYAKLVMSKGSASEKELALKGAVASGEATDNMHKALGDIYVSKKMYDQAIVEYEKASKLNPKDDKLLSALGDCQVKKGALKEATTTYEQVIALNPRATKELKALGDLYLKQKKNSLAIKYFKKYLDKKPDDYAVALTVGEAAMNAKQFSDAEKYLGMVRGAAEKKPSFIKMYADACYKTKNYPKALIQYKKLVKLTPKDATIYKRMYEINLKTGAKNDALSNLNIYTKFRPKDAEALRDLGNMYYAKGKKTEALSAYRKAITADAKINKIYKNYVSLVLEYGKYREKMSAMNGAIAAGEADANVYKTLGGIYAKAKNYNKALSMYKEAVKLDRKNSKLLIDYADCLVKTGALEKASSTLEQALKINPSATKEYKLLGDLNMKQKKTDAAIKAYVKYLSKASSDEATARIVAEYYYGKKKYSEAYKYYSMVKKDTPISVLVPFGMSALQTKKYREAITALEKVRVSKSKVSGRDAAYKALAEAYEKSGNPKKAAEVLHDYIKLPGVKDPDAAYRIASVYESIDVAKAVKIYKSNTSRYPKDYRNFLKLGFHFINTKNDKGAIVALEKCIKLVDTIPDVYLKLGSIYNRLNRRNDMLRVYRKFLEVAPQNAGAQAQIGKELLEKNMTQDAMVFLEMANSIDDDNPKYMTLLARGYLATDRQREGARLLEKVVKKSRGNISKDLRITLADVYMATNRYGKAADELKELIKTDNSKEVMIKYAKALFFAGKENDALKIAQRVKAKDPMNVKAQMMVGQIQVAQKKYNDAIETYKEILYVDQNYAPALCARANVYLIQGKTQWAQTFYDRALKADPNNAMVYLGLARLAKEKKDYASYTNYIEKARKLDPQNREIQAEMRSTR